MTNTDQKLDSDFAQEKPPMALGFGIGDRVRLRSGGMSMTVTNVLDTGMVVVAWSASGGYSLWGEGPGIRRESFPAVCLEKAP